MQRDLFFVTGGTGYIGGAVIDLLLSKGIKVRALARSSAKADQLLKRGVKDIAIGDFTDPESLKPALEGVGGVYHIGALYREAGLPDETFFAVNAQGTRNIFEASIAAGVERIVHCSTGGVLGHIANPPAKETDPYNPGDVYQRSKVEGEQIALSYFKSGKIRGAVIRPAMVYGPADTRHLKMFKMIAKKMFFYVGKGDAWVNFIDVRDLANSFLLAMQAEHINGEVYHISNSTPMKLHEAVKVISNEFGVPEPWLHLPVKPMQTLGTVCETVCAPLGIKPPIFRRRVDFFTKSRYFDNSKAQRELGFAPAQSFEKEVKDAVQWYRQNGWV